MKIVRTSLWITLSLVFAASCRYGTEPSAEEIGAIKARLTGGERPAFVSASEETLELWKTLGRFYESRSYRPVWLLRGHVHQGAADNLQRLLSQAPLHGLNPSSYDTAPSSASSDPVEHELRLSWALFQFAFDVANTDAPVESVIARKLEEGSLLTLADELAPTHAQYRGLQKALQNYRSSSSPDNTNASEIERIELNMARYRELPSDLGPRHILVNVPQYSLSVVEDGHDVLTMNVVVGKVETPTPVFSEDMKYIVFSPYWNIPESILTGETLPRAAKEKNYLERQNIEILRGSGKKRQVVDPSEIDWSTITARSGYQFRQRPGPANSLGLVKFMLPNRFDIYLHDTPADGLFKEAERHFSHGCVRLAEPLALAEYLLRDNADWPTEKIQAAMNGGIETTVLLDQPVPVHIVYFTAWVRPDGTVEFFKDIYNHDQAVGA